MAEPKNDVVLAGIAFCEIGEQMVDSDDDGDEWTMVCRVSASG